MAEHRENGSPHDDAKVRTANETCQGASFGITTARGAARWFYAEEVTQNFPTPHHDLLEQYIPYRVPMGKFDQLAAFDGSVLVDRTKGEISARCTPERTNDSQYASARGEHIAAELIDTGVVFVNQHVSSGRRLLFGGIKESGYGRELSHYGIKEFVNMQDRLHCLMPDAATPREQIWSLDERQCPAMRFRYSALRGATQARKSAIGGVAQVDEFRRRGRRTMKAIRIHGFGGPEVLQLDDIPIPQPREDELLVRIRAASVNPVDYKIRRGAVPWVTREMLPILLGRDLSGTVEGAGVGAFGQGEAVYAMLGGIDRGSYAQYVVVKPNEAAPKPARLSHIEAAAVPLAALTAWQGSSTMGIWRPARQC